VIVFSDREYWPAIEFALGCLAVIGLLIPAAVYGQRLKRRRRKKKNRLAPDGTRLSRKF
jgi:uncharacterized integral membrane protein